MGSRVGSTRRVVGIHIHAVFNFVEAARSGSLKGSGLPENYVCAFRTHFIHSGYAFRKHIGTNALPPVLTGLL